MPLLPAPDVTAGTTEATDTVLAVKSGGSDALVRLPYGADLAARDADIAANAADIATNTANIATNTADIAVIAAGSVISINGEVGTVVLDPDDLDDATTTNKFATAAQLAAVDALGTASTSDTGDFATAAQGALADTATQPGDLGALAIQDVISISDIDATGTADSTTTLYGDGSWGPAGGLVDIASDLTPSLGGDLDADSFKISNASQYGGERAALSFTAGEADADFSSFGSLYGTITAVNDTVHLVGAAAGKTLTGILTLTQDGTGGHAVTIDGYTSSEGDVSVSQAADAVTRLAVLYDGTEVTLIGQVNTTQFYEIDGPTPVSITDGGTGGTTAGEAQVNLGLGTAATADATDFATAAQGALADSAAQKASNLSDLASASTARTNLGLGTAATTASTAYATAAQGTTADSAVQKAQTVNAQTGTTYTLVLADGSKLVTLSNASAITLTVPSDATAAIAIGTYVDLMQLGAGQVTVVAGSGATLRVSGLTAKARAQYARLGVQKISANTWSLFGDLAAS